MRRLLYFLFLLPTLLFGQVAPGIGAPNFGGGSPSTSYFQPAGATTPVDLQTLLFGYDVDVRSYGAKPDDLTFDQSTAVNAAIAALPNGGTVFFPRGKYKFNAVVNQDNIRILFDSMPTTTTTENYFMPYNAALPVIKVGNDTKRVYGFRMDNVALYGGDATGTGQIGLQINGGVNGAWIRNLSVRNFGAHGIQIGPGSAYEIQWVFFDGLVVRTPAAGTPVGFGMYYGTAPSWLTVVDIKHYWIETGGAFGYAVITDSVKASFNAGWMQVSPSHGIKFQNNYAGSTPRLDGICNTVEAGGSQVAVEVYNNSKRKADFFVGQWHITDLIKLLDTTTYAPNGDWSSGKFELYQPVIQDAYIADATTPTQTNLHLRGSGNNIQLVNDSGGTVAVTSSNNVDLTSNNLRILTTGYGLVVKEGSNCTMGSTALTAGSKVVSTTKVTANSRIYLTSNADGGTPGWLRVSARSAGTSFTITSSSGSDTSTVAWLLVEPAP